MEPCPGMALSPASTTSLPPNGEPPSPSTEIHAEAPTTLDPANRTSRPRSCHPCHSRKVRCDRRLPCSQCQAGGRTCSYPPPGERVRRKRKTTIADVASRIFDLERSLVAVSGASPAVASTPRGNGNVVCNSREPSPEGRGGGGGGSGGGDGVLVQKGTSSQYFNEVLLSKVIEQQHDIQSALVTPRGDSSSPIIASPFNPMGILSSPSYAQTPSSFHPPTATAVRLWNRYVENVQFCNKVVHTPTAEAIVFSVIADPPRATFEDLTLCFAIYYATTASLDNAAASALLGQDKVTALVAFKVGMEQAFAHSDFLDNPTLTSLHALAIFQGALRAHNRGKGVWVLTGLSIRMAQSIGLHRDGEKLGLSPFESEIRRRLWWHLVAKDGRAGEDYGLQNTLMDSLQASSTRPPLNVDDHDLYPDMKELPPPRERWTEMTFALASLEICKTSVKLASLSASSGASEDQQGDVRARLVAETKERVEQIFKHCNPVIPQQRLALYIFRLVIRKQEFVARQQWTILRHIEGGAHDTLATEENLLEALDILQFEEDIRNDELLKPYIWSFQAFPQYHIALSVLWHLCVNPEGPSVERAWAAVDALFEKEELSETAKISGSKWTVLQAMREKAASIRRTRRCEGANAPDARTSEDPGALFTRFGGTAEETAALSGGYPVDSSIIDWGGNMEELPAWEALLNGIQWGGHELTGF